MNSQIKIAENILVPRGNMSFILDLSKYQKLFERCVALEQTLRSDYDAFALNFRLVLEEFAICEETKLRIIESNMRFNEQTTRERITQEIKRGQTSYVDIVIDFCLSCENAAAIEGIVKKQCTATTAWSDARYEEELERYIRNLFRFASMNAHSGERTADCIPTNDLCREQFRKLYSLLSAYYGHKSKFDGNLLPFRDYYPIPKSIREANGIWLEKGKQLYVREQDGTLRFYLFVTADAKISDTQKRDIETIHRLWMDNFDSPQNVINNPTFVSNKNSADYRFWVYPLPSFPASLTDAYIDDLSSADRLQLIRGIVRGVASMHKAEPPFYHRSLSPSAFLICKVRDRLKPLLVNFDCVKDTDEDAEYSVFYAVSDKLTNDELKNIFAPELYCNELSGGDSIDWAKVDVFALGKTIVKILTNTYAQNTATLGGLTDEQKQCLSAMCSENLNTRPDIDTVSNTF